MDVLVRKVTELGLSTLFHSLSTHYRCGQWSLSHTWWFCIPHRFWPIESHAIKLQWSSQAILLTPIFDWCVWLGEDQRTNTNKTKTIFSEIGLCLQILWTTPYSIVNTIMEDLWTQFRNQQTCTFNNHNWIMGGPIFDLIFGDASV
jgi:hypothetical protein